MDQLQRRTMRELTAQGIEVSGADTDFAGIVRKPVVTSKVQLNGVGEYRQVPACWNRVRPLYYVKPNLGTAWIVRVRCMTGLRCPFWGARSVSI